MTLKFNVTLLLCSWIIAIAATAEIKPKKDSPQPPKAPQGDKDEARRQYDQYYNNKPPQYTDTGLPPQREQHGHAQDGYGYGPHTYKKTGSGPIAFGNGRGNTNVVTIQGNDPAYITRYPTGENYGYDYNEYRDETAHAYNSKGNNGIFVKERPSGGETVVLSSTSRKGDRSTIVVNPEKIDTKPRQARPKAYEGDFPYYY